MKKLITVVFLICSLWVAKSQHTLIYTHDDLLFEQGKELFNQRKFAASYRSFEAFLEKADITKAGQRHEAEYFLVANAYELRQDRVYGLILSFLNRHPYTTYLDKVQSMLGILLYEEKNYAGAINHFNKVNADRFGLRERTEFLFCKGYALLETKNYEQALGIFRELRLEESDYQIKASYYYAYTEYTLRNYHTALQEFLKIEDEEEYKQKIAYYLVQIYYHLGDVAEMSRRSDILLQQYPDSKDNAEIYRIKGEMAYQERNYNQAIEFMNQYEQLSPQMLRTDLYILGLSYINTLRYTAAIGYLQRVTTEKDELTENAYMHLGNSFLKIGDKLNARLAFEAALSTNFNKEVREAAMLNYALTTYETTTAFGESISAFELFLTEYPNSRHADQVKSYLANEYMTTKNYEHAYQSIIKIANPNEKILEAKQYLLYQLGTEAFAQNNFEKAVNYFTLSIQNAPGGVYAAESYYWRSESYYRMNMTDNSIRDLQTFLKMPSAKNNTNYVVAHYSMGYAYFSQQNFREARRYFETYSNLETRRNTDIFADALNRIGDCYYYDRDFKNAEMMYSRSTNLSPNTGDYALFQSAYVAGLQKKYSTKIQRLNDLVESYPNSAYADDALYEVGRSYLMLNNENEALNSYRRLLSLFPNSVSARKGALEIGMIYLNQERQTESLTAFKSVVANYPGTEEAYTALEIVENIYIEMNDVPAYLAYMKTINMSMPGINVNHEDSISYLAAEKQYMNANYSEAISGFRSYLKNFCSGGGYCSTAQYYLADSYYRIQDYNNALKEFKSLLDIPGNQYMEEAVTRCAEISYNQGDFLSSLSYFQRLESMVQTVEMRNTARLGVLRCSYQLKDYPTTIGVATEIINDGRSAASVVAEARYNRAKSYIDSDRINLAMDDLKRLSSDTRTATGAEAKYLLAWVYFQQNTMALAEKEVLDFAQKNTPYQYWLARSFVLLADIYISQGNDFQAKQYLLSLQRNYTTDDDIQIMIDDRLNAISARERANVIG